MTGFGVGKAQSKTSKFEVTIRSVNGRYLETRFHLPRELMAYESELKKILNQSMKRGTVDVFINRKFKPSAQAQKISINEDLALEYKKTIDQIAKKTKLKSVISAETLLRLPEVIRTDEVQELGKEEEKCLKKAFEEACEACASEKKREGQSLRKDLEKHLTELENFLKQVREHREEANSLLEEKMRSRLQQKTEGIQIDPQRLAQEVLFQLDKSDINEEIVRLSEHLKAYRKMVEGDHAEGKKLDFYTQELLREVNTIGSKSQMSKMTQVVVSFKTVIERLREQVQNIE